MAISFSKLLGAAGSLLTTWRFRRIGQAAGLVKISGHPPKVMVRGTCIVGKGVFIRGSAAPVRLGSGKRGTITIGDNVLINQGVTIYAAEHVSIGDHVKIGDYSVIYDTSFHEVDQGAGAKIAPVRIGRNVWLGRGVTVLPGVEIGDHSVISAGAIVTKSIPPKSLAVGNPARVIREISASDDYIRP
jgi:Acetyltransferase (isoleucine patch superfamily)